MSPWKYTLAYLIPVSVITGFALGGAFTFLTPVVVFVLIPILDFVVGADDTNLPSQQMEKLADRLSFRVVLYLYVPVQTVILLFGAFAVANGERTWLEITGMTLSVGVMTGGLGITIAHELAHKKRRLHRTLGQLLLMSVSYMHFYIEHNIGHHTNVATIKDPATARFGESFYQTLRHFDESPQLPTGYAGMILLALVPPLWHKIMDPKVLKLQSGVTVTK